MWRRVTCGCTAQCCCQAADILGYTESVGRVDTPMFLLNVTYGCSCGCFSTPQLVVKVQAVVDVEERLSQLNTV